MTGSSRRKWLDRGGLAASIVAVNTGAAGLWLWLWPPPPGANVKLPWAVSLVVEVLALILTGRVWPWALQAAEAPRNFDASLWLERTATLDPPAPDPLPIAYPPPSPRRAWLWAGAALLSGVGSALLVVGKWEQRDYVPITLGALSLPLCVWLAARIWCDRHVSTFGVDARGLHGWQAGRTVAWESVEDGWISYSRGSNGDLGAEWLYLEDASEYCVWERRIKNLPPNVRRDLFAWLQARAGLREPDADA